MFDLDALYKDLFEARNNTTQLDITIWIKLSDIKKKYPALFNYHGNCLLYIRKNPEYTQKGDFQIEIKVSDDPSERIWEFKIEKYVTYTNYTAGYSCSSVKEITKEQLEQAFVDKIKKLTKESEYELNSLMPLAKLLGVR